MTNQLNISRISLLVLFLISINQARTQDLFTPAASVEVECSTLLGNVNGRATHSLNGTWNVLIDPNKNSVFNDLFHYAERNHKAEPGELMELSLENGSTLRVPGDWNTQDERLFFYNGKVWYKKDFWVDKDSKQRYYLHFGAVNYRADIYVNGTQVATHKGGFTSFNCEVTDHLIAGENLLVVKVNNILTDSDIPTTRTDWLNYGGITRDVNLVTLPQTFIENYKLQLSKNNSSQINGWATINGASTGSLMVKIPELQLSKSFPIVNGKAEIIIDANPQLWSPDQPKLYDVELSLGSEVLKDRVGFRTISIKEGQVLLNDKSITLKGISIHEEAIGAAGRAYSKEHARELLQAAKELNCNFVRLAHYTHNENMVLVADEMGLLVWAEIPVYWNVEFENPEVLAMAKSRMDEMIGRDQNRASIAIWSLGNETPKSDARNSFFRSLNQHVKSLDDTRLTSAALVFGAEEIGLMAKQYYFPTLAGQSFDLWDIEIEDPLAEIVDLPAVNQYFGWYYSGFLAGSAKMKPALARKVMLDNMSKIRFHIPNNKPYIFSELGAGAKKGMTGKEEDMVIFSEDYQALVYKKQIELYKNQTGIVGMSPWILKDFRSTLRQRQGIQDYWNRKGLINDNGERKKAFFILQEFYKNE